MVDEIGGRTCYALYQPELLPRRWGRLDLNQRPRSPLEKTHPSRIDQRKIGEVVASGFFYLITERNRTDQLFAGVPAKSTEAVRIELTVPRGTPVFKTSAFGRSATLPRWGPGGNSTAPTPARRGPSPKAQGDGDRTRIENRAERRG